jgi:Ca2+:H+ antiporter
MLIFVPLALVADFVLHIDPVLIFIFAALGIIPLADFIGEATEELAIHTGPRLGGLLNATLGNAAELIITIFALRQGLLDLVP